MKEIDWGLNEGVYYIEQDWGLDPMLEIKQIDGIMQMADFASLDPEKQALVKKLLDKVTDEANAQQRELIERYRNMPVLS